MSMHASGRPRATRRLLAFFLAGLLAGCVLDGGSGADDPPVRGPESGFVHLGPIHYFFHYAIGDSDYAYDTTPANLWYSFHPAEAGGAGSIAPAPVFVMLNGGPGAATSANLFALNTAPYTLDADWLDIGGPGYKANEWRWTKLGHVLYIDPAQTGFSYNVNPAAVGNDSVRIGDYFFKGNFNPFIDAAQVLRVVLRFLHDHPDLQGNPVVFVGESYGGTRVSTMLNLLLFSERYAAEGTSFYRDDGLVAEIRAHFRELGKPVAPLSIATVTAQFGRQVLIQPQLSGPRQDAVQGEMYWDAKPSIIDEIAEQAGFPGGFTRNDKDCAFGTNHATCPIMSYLPKFNRDRYHYLKPESWSDDLEFQASSTLGQRGKLATVTGFDVGSIAALKAPARVGAAYHFLGVVPPAVEAAIAEHPGGMLPGLLASAAYREARLREFPEPVDDSLAKNFGDLGRWDRYFVAMNTDVYLAFMYNFLAPEYVTLPINADHWPTYGDFFLENARHVKTFLTDARYDVVIYSPALPVALARHVGSVRRIDWMRGENAPLPGKLGRFEIHYVDGSTVPLYYPFYGGSGHAVGATEPKKLRDDVGAWLGCTADGTC